MNTTLRWQARADRTLREKLLAERDVQKAIARVHEDTSGFGFSSRRRLLTGALRLTRSMSPEVADALASCKRTLGYDKPIEVFVRPDPMLNASCMRQSSGPTIIVLSSRLLEVFSPAELKFVIGHELGHVVFDHFAIPMPITAAIEDIAGTLVTRTNALRLYLWCRAAEISADRAGLVCAQDPEAAASGFFKLASGLASPRVRADLEAYAQQVDALVAAPAARSEPRDDDDTIDAFSTHPYSPLRVRAVVAFSKSRTYREAIGGRVGPDLSDEDVESVVERDMAMMEPSYLEEKTVVSELMRRILYCGGVLVAAANGDITKGELDSLKAMLGAEAMYGVVDPAAATKELDKKLEEAKTAPMLARALLVQHLTIIAAADGVIEPVEIAVIQRIAERLGVSAYVIEQAIHATASPMD